MGVLVNPSRFGIAAIAVTLNPSDKDANATLSNGNLSVTRSSGSAHALARATIGKSSGKWYWEVRQDAAFSNDSQAAAITKAGVFGSVAGSVDGYSYDGINGYFYHAGVGTPGAATWTIGDVIGVEFDATGGTIKYYKNNVLQGTVTGISAGTWFPTVGVFDTGSTVTCRFAAASQSYPTRSGGYVAIG